MYARKMGSCNLQADDSLQEDVQALQATPVIAVVRSNGINLIQKLIADAIRGRMKALQL
jgi:hypothetical protein